MKDSESENESESNTYMLSSVAEAMASERVTKKRRNTIQMSVLLKSGDTDALAAYVVNPIQ